MEAAIGWFGYGCAVLVVILIALALATAVVSAGSAVCNRWYERGIQRGIETVNERIRTDAWWFSEDKPTLDLIMEIGRGGGFDVSLARERWRRSRAQQQAPPAPAAQGKADA